MGKIKILKTTSFCTFN